MWIVEPDNGNRWRIVDGDRRHLLQRTSGRAVELHGTTVHVYDVGADVDQGAPLAGASWVRTERRGDLAGVDDTDAWVYLANPSYVDPAYDPPPEE